VSDTARPVVVTRAEPRDGALSAELARIGLPVLRWPVVGIEPADPAEWERHRRAIGTFDWIVFTSAHAVEVLADALPTPAHARIAAVGASTAEALRERGWPVDLTGRGNGAEGLLGPLAEAGVGGRRVLHPTSSRALSTLSDGLERLGAEVVRFTAYHTVGATLDVADCRSWISRRGIGAVTFTSPSAVIELERALGGVDFARLLADAPALAIGPTTAHELETRAVTPVVASVHTLRGLALACEARLRSIRPGTPGAQPEHATAPRAAKRLET
jgi:uroporphyrinogen-III synthase